MTYPRWIKNTCSYAELLLVRDDAVSIPSKTRPRPEILPRPMDESVPSAIKRLSLSYPMLQDTELLHCCSTLMSDHILKGKGCQRCD